MELYVLDSNFRRVEVIDTFESLIWTERQRDLGDFELLMVADGGKRDAYVKGTRFGLNESLRVMEVDTVEVTVSSDGLEMTKIKGKSLEAVLDDRMALAAMTNLNTTPKWTITNRPAAIARQVFSDICITGKLNVGDKLPAVTTNVFPPDTIQEPLASITHDIEPTTVLNAIKNLCDIHGMGFRLVRNLNGGSLMFNIYTGVDRTSKQDNFKAVVFSRKLDNLQNTTELKSIAGMKNVAVVISKWGVRTVYPVGVAQNIAGFDRRVLYVQATDITIQDGPELQALLLKRGQEELTKYREVNAYDGEVSQYGSYKYGVDYHLGDLVEMRSDDDETTNMRVSEQIFVSDGEGDRSYPTLIIDTFVMSGTWIAWDYDQTWSTAVLEWGTA